MPTDDTQNQFPDLPDLADARIAIIGLGYVGLPLALEFAKKFQTIGFDINQTRIGELRDGIDRTQEAEATELREASNLEFSSEPADLAEANVYIVTVPTPIDEHKRPDLRPLISASTTVGKALKPGNIVIFESTVYPGCTQEDCVPILEAESGLACAFDVSDHRPPTTDHRSELSNHRPLTTDHRSFFVGYSPERINPGDKAHRLPTIMKVTSGSTKNAANFVDDLYKTIITAGTHKAPSIMVAEAAKVIENTQRDVNIGLINELAMLFGKMGLDTSAVLEAAGTKWNFLPFRPGLVGGHCIGVDPYYLTYKAAAIGFHPQMILAGRRTNDGMGAYVAGELVKLMAQKGVYRPGARVLILGLTFKENCPDLRNTRVVDVIAALKTYSLEVDVHDPWADAEEARHEYGLEMIAEPEQGVYDAITLSVAHNEFKDLAKQGIRAWGKETAAIYDLKHVLPEEQVDARL